MLKIFLFYGDGIDPKNEGEGVKMEDSKMGEGWRWITQKMGVMVGIVQPKFIFLVAHYFIYKLCFLNLCFRRPLLSAPL